MRVRSLDREGRANQRFEAQLVRLACGAATEDDAIARSSNAVTADAGVNQALARCMLP